MKSVAVLCITLVMCILCFWGCDTEKQSNKTITEAEIKSATEAEIKSALTDFDGTLTIEGDAENVKSFQYVLTDINAENLIDKNYTKNAVNTMLNNSSQLTFGEYKVCKAFGAVMAIAEIFIEDLDNYDANALIDELLGIICNGKSQEYNGWTISASVDQKSNSITVYATSK